MQNMFSYSQFNRNISKWDVFHIKNYEKYKFMFLNCPIKIKYQPKFIY